MQEVFEKIIEKLEEYKYLYLVERDSEQLQHCKDVGDCGMRDCTLCVFDKAIEIVKQEAEQYTSTEHINCSSDSSTNGWIPCSERLPEEYDSIFAKAKGTDKWNDAMFEKTSDYVIVTVADVYGNKVTTHAHTVDGKWHCDLLRINKSYQIIAWQPLPEPYKEQ